MKLLNNRVPFQILSVASLAEAWIETTYTSVFSPIVCVASLAEAWIETSRLGSCGACVLVASLAEAWIETYMLHESPCLELRRLPRGGVD